eukprot:scaffold7560_cov390-Prasinococcus_capsulatus_cf.AAC.7
MDEEATRGRRLARVTSLSWRLIPLVRCAKRRLRLLDAMFAPRPARQRHVSPKERESTLRGRPRSIRSVR